jgi:hypothetical protein
MAGVALAIRLYELDHGQRPAMLAELVPDYLASVPCDPFDGNNGSIRYKPDAPSPVLYSVGVNGADESGLVASKKSGAIDRFAGDQPFYLNADRPLPPTAPSRASTQSTQPSTQAVPDDQEVESERGQQGEQDQ